MRDCVQQIGKTEKVRAVAYFETFVKSSSKEWAVTLRE